MHSTINTLLDLKKHMRLSKFAFYSSIDLTRRIGILSWLHLSIKLQNFFLEIQCTQIAPDFPRYSTLSKRFYRVYFKGNTQWWVTFILKTFEIINTSKLTQNNISKYLKKWYLKKIILVHNLNIHSVLIILKQIVERWVTHFTQY